MRCRERDTRRRERAYRRARIRHFLFTVGPHRVSGGRITRRHLAQEVVVNDSELWSPQWPASFDGLRIGHVSDFHLGDLLPLDKALEVVECLREQEPELVACTGDVVDLHNDGEAGLLFEALGRIDAPCGVFLVLGNHDELHDPDGLTAMARACGVTVLRNDVVQVIRNGESLLVGGIEWARSALRCARHIDVAGAADADLLLAHNPKAFLRAADLGIPLTLSGHTHGGQIAMKKRPNTNLALLHRRSVGAFEADGSLLYVTSGVGAWFPLRVNCPAEIAMLTVRCVGGERNGEGADDG
jgi:predicted MPP superfamily phosphohydrolase